MGKKIFFVDDDKMILNLLEYTVQGKKDYEVVSLLNGEDCLARLDEKPSLIVLDYILSGPGEERLSGLETLVEIRKKDEDVPVVILTGQGDDTLLTEFMDKGASHYLTKDDFFVDSVLETIQQFIS